MLHYTAYVCLNDIDVKQTYSRFHRNSNTTIGIIAVDVFSATLTGRLKCNKATFLFSSSFGEYL